MGYIIARILDPEPGDEVYDPASGSVGLLIKAQLRHREKVAEALGKPVDELTSNPLPDGALEKVYKDRELTNHVANFFEAVAARKEPISDVFSHHRALTTCHLGGIAARPDPWHRCAARLAVDPDRAARVLDENSPHCFGCGGKEAGKSLL